MSLQVAVVNFSPENKEYDKRDYVCKHRISVIVTGVHQATTLVWPFHDKQSKYSIKVPNNHTTFLDKDSSLQVIDIDSICFQPRSIINNARFLNPIDSTELNNLLKLRFHPSPTTSDTRKDAIRMGVACGVMYDISEISYPLWKEHSFHNIADKFQIVSADAPNIRSNVVTMLPYKNKIAIPCLVKIDHRDIGLCGNRTPSPIPKTILEKCLTEISAALGGTKFNFVALKK